MGTATPSFESLHNARTQKFGYVRLSSRFGDAESPEVILADIKVATKRKQMVSHFTPQLMEAIKEALERKGAGDPVSEQERLLPFYCLQ